jgi:streptogramin lyase
MFPSRHRRWVPPDEAVHRTLPGWLAVVLCAALIAPVSARAEGGEPLLAYDVPGSPQEVAVESPGRVWFSLPEEDAIGLLTTDGTGQASVEVRPLPPGSEPWDIAYVDGQIWWIGKDGAQIGRMDAVSGVLETFSTGGHSLHVALVQGGSSAAVPPGEQSTLPVPGAHLSVLAGDTPEVWYTVPGAGWIGRLTVPATGSPEVNLYRLPTGDVRSAPADIRVQSAARVWVTVPNRSLLYQYVVITGQWIPVHAGVGSAPWSLDVMSGSPWFTDVAGDRIGTWNPGTLSMVYWRAHLEEGSRPSGLVLSQGYAWYTEEGGHRVGRVGTARTGVVQRLGLPGETPNPSGIAVDAGGAVWIAAPGTGQVLLWQPPYFYRVLVPSIRR